MHETKEVMKLFEMILVEIVKEPPRSDRVPRDLEIVNVLLPIGADVLDGCHEGDYSNCQPYIADGLGDLT